MANFFSRQHTYILRLKSNQNLSMKRFSYKTPCNRVTYSLYSGRWKLCKRGNVREQETFWGGREMACEWAWNRRCARTTEMFFLYYWARRLPRARERNGVWFEETHVKQKTREDKRNVCLAFARLLPARVRGRNGARVDRSCAWNRRRARRREIPHASPHSCVPFHRQFVNWSYRLANLCSQVICQANDGFFVLVCSNVRHKSKVFHQSTSLRDQQTNYMAG